VFEYVARRYNTGNSELDGPSKHFGHLRRELDDGPVDEFSLELRARHQVTSAIGSLSCVAQILCD